MRDSERTCSGERTARHSDSGLLLEESAILLRLWVKVDAVAVRAAARGERAETSTRVLRELMRRFMQSVQAFIPILGC